MTLWVLDTDSLSLLERGNLKIQERLRQINADSVAISIITAEEKVLQKDIATRNYVWLALSK